MLSHTILGILYVTFTVLFLPSKYNAQYGYTFITPWCLSVVVISNIVQSLLTSREPHLHQKEHSGYVCQGLTPHVVKMMFHVVVN